MCTGTSTGTCNAPCCPRHGFPHDCRPPCLQVFLSSAYQGELDTLVEELRRHVPGLRHVVGCTVSARGGLYGKRGGRDTRWGARCGPVVGVRPCFHTAGAGAEGRRWRVSSAANASGVMRPSGTEGPGEGP